ncbi:MAG: hypothetical protein H0X66_04235 [Verrucomicrobia bacterium]|nr:hypothetical protein [Verrucomicrobiota bacterium]
MLKKDFNSRFLGFALVASILVTTTVDANAYIDPGSSSYFFQLLIAGLTAFVYFFSNIKRRVLSFFRKEAPQPEKLDETDVKEQTLKKDDLHTSK